MPGFDGSGPLGQGPASGRGFGPCVLGLGWRRRFGIGRGLGRYFCWNWSGTKKDQLEALKQYKNALKEELEDVEKEEKNFRSKSKMRMLIRKL